MYKTPVANRLHISIFGRRNVGKSSFINALTNQSIAIVSDTPGTTTDPVYKTIEILPEPGPCVIIDTAGLDDVGKLGELRKEKTLQVLNKTDLAIVLLEPNIGLENFELELIKLIKSKNTPIVLAWNKCDLVDFEIPKIKPEELKKIPAFEISSKLGDGINELRSKLKKYADSKIEDVAIVKGLVSKGDTVVLVIPIDDAMPKGRLILPEVQTLRSVLDEDAHAVVCKDYELESTLKKLKKAPDLVITDSQAFHTVKNIVPENVKLTSFSILFARYKGDLSVLINGAEMLNKLKPNYKILIAESCTHHPQENDIGRTKIPNLLRKKAGGELQFEYVVGADFPQELNKYDLIVMCGSCMINSRMVNYRIRKAKEEKVPITNYGVLFASMNGILERTSWILNYDK